MCDGPHGDGWSKRWCGSDYDALGNVRFQGTGGRVVDLDGTTDDEYSDGYSEYSTYEGKQLAYEEKLLDYEEKLMDAEEQVTGKA